MIEDPEERIKFILQWQKEHKQPTREELVKLIQQLGKPPAVFGADMDPTKIRCACNKEVPCEAGMVAHTGVMTIVEPVCKPCIKDFDGMARLACIRCKSVIGWLEPQTDPHGFKIEPNKYYHIGECAVCKKDLQKADIIEMLLYYDKMGIPYDKGLIT